MVRVPEKDTVLWLIRSDRSTCRISGDDPGVAPRASEHNCCSLSCQWGPLRTDARRSSVLCGQEVLDAAEAGDTRLALDSLKAENAPVLGR